MNQTIEYRLNEATEEQLTNYLLKSSDDFIPPLSSRVEINGYAKKIANNAIRFEAWSSSNLVGLVAVYCNDLENHIAFITSVNVRTEWIGNGVAINLMSYCLEYMKGLGVKQINLEVAADNLPAIRLYEKSGFVLYNTTPPFMTMRLYLKSEEEHE